MLPVDYTRFDCLTGSENELGLGFSIKIRFDISIKKPFKYRSTQHASLCVKKRWIAVTLIGNKQLEVPIKRSGSDFRSRLTRRNTKYCNIIVQY